MYGIQFYCVKSKTVFGLNNVYVKREKHIKMIDNYVYIGTGL